MNTSSHTAGRIVPRTSASRTPLQRAIHSIVAALETARSLAFRAYARHQQWRRARAAFVALHDLDERVLRDLGFHRSEIGSVVAELTGAAPPSRVRVLQSLHDQLR